MTRGQSGSLLLSLCGSFIHDTSPVCTGARIGSKHDSPGDLVARGLKRPYFTLSYDFTLGPSAG